MVDTPVAFDQRDPSACISLKRSDLVQIERVANLTLYWLTVLHCSPSYISSVGPPLEVGRWQCTENPVLLELQVNAVAARGPIRVVPLNAEPASLTEIKVDPARYFAANHLNPRHVQLGLMLNSGDRAQSM
jgi:hypothetical protein